MGKDNKIKTVNEWLNRDDLEQGYTIEKYYRGEE